MQMRFMPGRGTVDAIDKEKMMEVYDKAGKNLLCLLIWKNL